MFHYFVVNTAFVSNYLMSIGGFIGYEQERKIIGLIIYIVNRNQINGFEFVGN